MRKNIKFGTMLVLIVFMEVFMLSALAEPNHKWGGGHHQRDWPKPDPEPILKAPPTGFYNSSSAIKSTEDDLAVDTDIVSRDHVSGTLVKIEWALVNPTEGEFDFSLISRELEQADIHNSFISLVVTDGKSMPLYVLDKCEVFQFEFRNEVVQTCLPWDPEYQKYKSQLVTALGESLDSNPNLAAIYFTYAAMGNGAEMHFRVDEEEFAARGYTPESLLQSYNDVMDMYISAFETTSVIMEVHEVFNSTHLAENAYNHCYDNLGSRCGVAIWWCASRMATDPNSSEYKVFSVAQQAVELSFAVCQTVGNFTDQPDRFDEGQGWTSEEAFRNEMDFFTNNGFVYFELWTKDITNESLIELIKLNY